MCLTSMGAISGGRQRDENSCYTASIVYLDYERADWGLLQVMQLGDG
jgi:hypothetical protein